MIVGRVFRTGAVAFLLTASGTGAQSLSEVRSPAELPSSGYAGKQYVDSDGCVFVRAGVGGNVDWVPRVDRQRRVLCGYPPTLPHRVTERPAPTPPASTPSAPTPPASSPPAPRGTAPVRTATAAPPPAVAPAPAAEIPRSHLTALAATCEGIPADGERFVSIGSRRYELRCGPQPVHPADPVHGTPAVAVARSLPVAPAPILGAGPEVIPEGYQSAYEPGRLNPYRGIGTPEGEAAMNRRWTQTLPRREIIEPRQRVVVVHPAAQSAGQVYRSSRNAPSAGAPEPAGLRVQVASFGDASNARRTVASFRALGLPVTTQQVQQGQRRYAVVYLGPFARRDGAQGGLAAARGAGFADARMVR